MNDINKLPKWAQEHIRKLERDIAIAKRALEEWKDEQSESPFYISEYDLGEFHTRYIQTHKMEVKYAGVYLSILLRRNCDSIEISWGRDDESTGVVAFVPYSFQSARLLTKENAWR